MSNPLLHPTRRAMWAGTMWSNMTRQSVYGVVNTTVTVRPFGHSPTSSSATEPGSQVLP